MLVSDWLHYSRSIIVACAGATPLCVSNCLWRGFRKNFERLGTEIKPVTVTKNLGVHIDGYLNFNEHITKTASDCMFKLTRVNRIKHFLDQSTPMYHINAFVFCKIILLFDSLELRPFFVTTRFILKNQIISSGFLCVIVYPSAAASSTTTRWHSRARNLIVK